MEPTVIRGYTPQDLPAMQAIWNQVVASGIAFPQDTPLDREQAEDFFASQSFTAVAQLPGGTVGGLYILHPNNVGRCGHIANASYAVRQGYRGEGIGRKMVRPCLENANAKGFRGLQFNAVVATNQAAIHLYESLGFEKIGKITDGYRLKDGSYEDIYIFFYYLGE